MDSNRPDCGQPINRQPSSNGLVGSKGLLHVTLLGIGLASAGNVFYWAGGLRIGMLEYMLCTLVSGCGMLCITLCLAEMTSALPFGGGLYGFARVTMGPYIGFLVGCCELLQSIAYTSTPLLPAGRYLTGLFDLPKVFDVVFWALLAALALAINLLGVRAFWTSNAILVSALIVLMLIYYAVAIPCMDCHEYDSVSFAEVNDHSVHAWFKNFPYSFGLFVGQELMPLACSDATRPSITVPRAQVIALAVLAVNAFLVIAVASCNTPGPIAISGSSDSVLYYAYHSRMHMTTQVAKALSIPALFASSCAFMYVYGKQLRSMAESGLFPTVLKHSFGQRKVPYVALIIGLCIAFFIFVATEVEGERLVNFCVVLGFFSTMIVDVILLIGFLQFRTKHSSLPRHFTSPLGKCGALFGIVVFLLGFFAVAGLYPMAFLALIVLMLYLFVFSVYYHFRVKQSQHFSAEEHRVMFIAYVINGNRRFKAKIYRRASVSSPRSSGGSTSIRRTAPRVAGNRTMTRALSRTWASGARIFPGDTDDGELEAISPFVAPPAEGVVLHQSLKFNARQASNLALIDCEEANETYEQR